MLIFWAERNGKKLSPQPTAAQSGTIIVRQLHKVIRHYFPNLFEQLNQLEDHRLRRDYEVSELLTASLVMFIFKQTSRNALNNDRREGYFRQNCFKLFKQRLPHMDTVEDFLRLLPPSALETLKAALVANLIEKKVFRKFRLLDSWFTVAIDATGTNSYTDNDAEGSRIKKTSKNDITTYYHHVVEAKLVTESGLSISLASEFVTNNPDRNYNKQDCEQRAFERLATKLKKYFPRLPICLLADGLYPNNTFMQTCHKNNWAYIVVLKDDTLKNLQEDIVDTGNKHYRSLESLRTEAKGKTHITQQFRWITVPLCHATNVVYWLSCKETTIRYDADNKPLPKQNPPTTFTWLTNQKVTEKNVQQMAQAGRNRWKIENEGFNTQKNGGYALGHKFSRKSFTSYKNYYQCMQIAHLINQLVIHSSLIAEIQANDKKLTVKHLWKHLLSWLTCTTTEQIQLQDDKPCQVRLK